jgi:hypothetical protein
MAISRKALTNRFIRNHRPDSLHLFSDKIAFKAPGADLKGNRGTPNLGFNLQEIRLPGTTGMILGMAHRIAGDRVFSANIADP